MRKVPLSESLKIIARGSRNWLAERPIVVSFEVTDACTCYCRHCDHGGPRDESTNLKPADYRRYMDELQPCVVQVSGGEPLMRDDLSEVVRNIKSDSGLPYIILVSSWSLMTEERYLELRDAGVDQFSVSLDFPDQRHDDFRCYPGLYDHLSDVIPRCASHGFDDIVLNTCITSANLHEVNGAADQAQRWGVNICYSAYSARRTGCRDYFLNTPEQHQILREQLARIEERRNGSNYIVSAPTHPRRHPPLLRVRRRRGMQGRPALPGGHRRRQAAALLDAVPQVRTRRPGDDGQGVHAQQHCDECYVAIRSNLDKSFPKLLRENVARYFSFK